MLHIGWAHSANYEYVVHIYTANKLFAGTDAPVFIKLYGNNDKELLGETRLTPNSKDPFEKGEYVFFQIINSKAWLGHFKRGWDVHSGVTFFIWGNINFVG